MFLAYFKQAIYNFKYLCTNELNSQFEALELKSGKVFFECICEYVYLLQGSIDGCSHCVCSPFLALSVCLPWLKQCGRWIRWIGELQIAATHLHRKRLVCGLRNRKLRQMTLAKSANGRWLGAQMSKDIHTIIMTMSSSLSSFVGRNELLRKIFHAPLSCSHISYFISFLLKGRLIAQLSSGQRPSPVTFWCHLTPSLALQFWHFHTQTHFPIN